MSVSVVPRALYLNVVLLAMILNQGEARRPSLSALMVLSDPCPLPNPVVHAVVIILPSR